MNSRVASATREKYSHIYQEGISPKVPAMLEQTVYLQALNIDERGNLLVVNPETGDRFKVTYNSYVRSMSIKSNQDNKSSVTTTTVAITNDQRKSLITS